jgi:hypothetical protein
MLLLLDEKLILLLYENHYQLSLDIDEYPSSPIYKEINYFIENTSDIVNLFKAERMDFYTTVEITLNQLKTGFNNIYEENIEDYLKN